MELGGKLRFSLIIKTQFLKDTSLVAKGCCVSAACTATFGLSSLHYSSTIGVLLPYSY